MRSGRGLTGFESNPAATAILIGLLLLSAVWACFGQVGSFDFAGFDDQIYVTANPVVRQGLSLEGLAWAMTTFHGANWHPQTWLSHMLDIEIWGLNPGGHHLSNLILHGINSLLLFVLLRRMTRTMWRSGLVAALFALHPLHVESVAWVAERKDLLSTFWGWLSLLAYVRYAETGGRRDYLLCLLCLVLGLLAKPMLVTWPFLMLLLDGWPLGRLSTGVETDTGPGTGPPEPGRKAIRAVLLEKLPLMVPVAFSCAVTLWAQASGGAVRPLHGLSLVARVSNALVAYVAYLFKAVWPRHLSVFYPHPWETIPGWQVFGAVLGISILILLCVSVRRRYPYLAVGLFWYLGTLVPVIGLVQVGGQAMADRYTYIPLTGIFIAAAWGLSDLSSRWPRIRVPVIAALMVVLFLLAMRTADQVKYWKNDLSLFRHAVRVDPGSSLAHNNLAAALQARGKLDSARGHLRRALEIDPGDSVARNNLGLLLQLQGKLPEAEREFGLTLSRDPDNVTANFQQGVIQMGQGRYGEAMAHFLCVLRVAPAHGEACYRIGLIFALEGRYPLALRFLAEAVRLNPANLRAREKLREVSALAREAG